MSHKLEESATIEEKFIRILRYASVKQIKAFLGDNDNSSMNLHYVTPNLKTPLTAAIDRGDTQILSVLLEKNPMSLDETLTQPCGRTALMYASFHSRTPEILQLLLKKGANAEKTDIRGWSCLQHAIIGERLDNVKFLLDYGVSVNQLDLQARTPVMISVHLSNLDVLLLLLERGGDIEARDKNGLTVLQLAILWRKRDAAVVLVERGCDTSVLTPLRGISVGELCKTTMPRILRCIEEIRV